MAIFGKIMLVVIANVFSVFASALIVLKYMGNVDYSWFVVLIPLFVFIGIESILVVVSEIMKGVVGKMADQVIENMENVKKRRPLEL